MAREAVNKKTLSQRHANDNKDDEKLCGEDVIIGLVRMQLLPRLRYSPAILVAP